MFASFQHFELKPLTLGGLFYLSAMAFLCLFYLKLDSPIHNANAELWQYPESQYWVTYELTDNLQSKDIHNFFNQALVQVDMSEVSFKLECDTRRCFVGFYSETPEGRMEAEKANGAMRNLPNM